MFKRLKKTLKQRGGASEGKRGRPTWEDEDDEENIEDVGSTKRLRLEEGGDEEGGDIIMESSSSAKPEITQATYYKQFAFSEWIHDWWNGYRNKAGGQEINFIIFEALVRILGKSATINTNEYKTDGLADDALKERLKLISNKTNELMSEFYRQFSPNAHITVSTIEDSSIAAFEDAVEYLSRPSPNAIISYAELFGYGNDLPSRMIEKRNEFRSITLDPVDLTVKDLTGDQKLVIRNAIKVFMTGEPDLTKQGPFYLTFDAAGKDVTKIFLGDENTYGLIMPANIADSATSSIKKIGKNENYFYFPTAPTSEVNTSLTDNYTIEFEDKGFSPLTPFAFDYVIKRDGVEISRSSFGDKITQGPSLDTLMTNHILAYKGEEFRHSGSSGCLDIAANFTEESVAGVQADVQLGKSIFQTAKMRGDYDQAKQLREAQKSIEGGGTFILVSADREEILTRRLHQGEAILHYGGTFTLYRTDARLDPAAIAAYNAAKSAKFVADNTSLYTAIYDISTKIDEFIANLPPYVSKVPIVTTLFANRNADITAYLTSIKSIVLPPKREDPLTEETIKSLFGLFEANGIPISSLIYLSTYKKPEVGAAKKIVYPFLKFSLEDYKTLEKQIKAARATMTSTRPVRIPEDFFNHVTQKEGYAETVDTILESFFDMSKVANDTITALKLPTPDKNKQEIITTFIEKDKEFNKLSIASRTTEIIEAQKKLRADATAASTDLRTQLSGHFSNINLIAVAGGGSRQRGGARPDQEVLDVVLEVLKETSIFVNQRIRDMDPGVITIANDNGKKTVSSINGGRKPLIDLINSISPSDAATHAGDLLNRLNELPEGDLSIAYIKLLLNPFNNDANGYINKGHPIAANKSLGYASKDGAETPADYFLGNIIDRPIIQKTRSVSKLLEPLQQEYSVYYDMLPSISDTKPTGNAKTYRELLAEGQFSEYIKAVYYAQIDGLITLAILNDLIERNFAENKSLLFGYIPKLGRNVPRIDITTDGGWGAIPGKLQVLFICVVDGEVPRELVPLLSGGSRKTQKRSHKKHTKNTKRLTRKRKE